MVFDYFNLTPLDAAVFEDLTFPIYRSRFSIFGLGRESPVVAVAARCGEQAAGLALAEWEKTQKQGVLLSVYVTEKYRRQGVGLELLHQMEKELAERGCRSLKVMFERHAPTQAFEGLLRKAGYPEPAVRSFAGRACGTRLKKAPWIRHQALPRSFEIFLWKELSADEKTRIRALQEQPLWHSELLSPFREESLFEPLNSVGLRCQGETVGWQINHRIVADTIRYSMIFVRQDLQRHGLAVPLLTESIRIQMEQIQSIPKATFVVPLDMESMMNFVRKHMVPYLEAFNPFMEARRELDG